MNSQPFDPDRHDSQLVAAFQGRDAADRARTALIEAGLSAHAVELVVDQPAQGSDGFWHAVRRLFAPAEDVHALGEALRSGLVMVLVHPRSVTERDDALAVLERCEPLDLEERDASGHAELNHATVTRADMIASAPLQAPIAPVSEPSSETTAAPGGATYTYGIPESVARQMTPDERTLAQAPDPQSRQEFVRIVEERLRVGWRDRTGHPTRTRHYVAERETGDQRVELREEGIPAVIERPGR